MRKQLLDHGYLEFIEDWGRGKAGEAEAGIIEAARQSTQGSFRGWEDKPCLLCDSGKRADPTGLTKCPDCEGTGTIRGDLRLLRFLFNGKPQHATPFEFCGMVIEVQAPTCVVWEWVRHRTHTLEDGNNAQDWAYNVMSSRYGVIPDLDYLPLPSRCLNADAKNRQAAAMKGAATLDQASALEWLDELKVTYDLCERTYQSGLRRGLPKEVARLALTFGRFWRFRVTAYLRNWLAFMTLRSDPAAQWEIRQYSNAVGEIIAERFPRTWSLFSLARSQIAAPAISSQEAR